VKSNSPLSQLLTRLAVHVSFDCGDFGVVSSRMCWISPAMRRISVCYDDGAEDLISSATASKIETSAACTVTADDVERAGATPFHNRTAAQGSGRWRDLVAASPLNAPPVRLP
jgi:hypothetical protein